MSTINDFDNEIKGDKQARKKFRVELPNIVDDLNLSVFEFRLYVHMRRVAGETGECWQSTDTLAKACGMSTGSVSKAKKKLLTPRDELNGKTLILRSDTNKSSDCFIVNDVWYENLIRYEKAKSLHHVNDDSPREHGVHHMNDSVHLMNRSVHHVKQRKNTEERTLEERTSEESFTRKREKDHDQNDQDDQITKTLTKDRDPKDREVREVEESLLRKIKLLTPVIPMFGNQKDALRQLAITVADGTCIEDDVLLCAEDLVNEHDLGSATPLSIYKHLGTFLARHGGRPHCYMYQPYGRRRPELYDDEGCEYCVPDNASTTYPHDPDEWPDELADIRF
jgi:hypothetical protein